jgi:hypothetical protein
MWVQVVAEGMSAIAASNEKAMVALHLSHRSVGTWFDAFENTTQQMWRAVKSPITIVSSRPVGYAPSWANNPLRMSQAWSLIKTFNSKQPTHNAFVKYSLNPKGPYRSLWCDAVVLQMKEYRKSPGEIRLKVCL